MWWRWGCTVLGLVAFSCGDSAALEPRTGAGDGGSGATRQTGGRTSGGGSVQSGGHRYAGGASAGGSGGGNGTGGVFFPTGGKSIEPTPPRRNPSWMIAPRVDGGVCLPVSTGPVYEYEQDYRDLRGCFHWNGVLAPQIVNGGTYPPGSHLAIPRAAEDGCAVICTCTDTAPDAGPPSRILDWVCPP